MKRPRYSLADLMVLIALGAADAVLLRLITESGPVERLWGSLFLVSPAVNFLVLGLYRMLRRQGEARPFLLGFELCGWIAVVAWLLAIWGAWEQVPDYSGQVVEPIQHFLLRTLGLDLVNPWSLFPPDFSFLCVTVPVYLVSFSAPLLIPALIGGWFTSQFKITIERRRPANPEPAEAVPAETGATLRLTPP